MAAKPATEPINPTTLAGTLRTELGLKCSRSKAKHGAWRTLNYLASIGGRDNWPYETVTALHGIAFARTTGRIDGATELRIRDLTDWRICAFVAEVAANCNTIGDVPGYLNRRTW